MKFEMESLGSASEVRNFLERILLRGRCYCEALLLNLFPLMRTLFIRLSLSSACPDLPSSSYLGSVRLLTSASGSTRGS